jgi:hypothetical protein
LHTDNENGIHENGNILSFYNIVYYTIAKGCVYVGELFDIHGLFYLLIFLVYLSMAPPKDHAVGDLLIVAQLEFIPFICSILMENS